MDSSTLPPWIDARELWRVRGSRLLVLGNRELIDGVISLLRDNEISVPTDSSDERVLSTDHQAYDLAVLCASPFCAEQLISVANACRSAHLPFCVILPTDRPDHRESALRLGAREVLSTAWKAEELFLRIVWLLAAKALQMRVRSVHVTLRKRMSAKSRLLDETRLEMINRLGRAAEYRDNETGQHVIRVGKFCEIVARQLRLPGRDINLLRHASPLHDIGKIGIADAILLKTAPLEHHEWKIMKQHTIIGAEILGGTDDELLETARIVALTHHERWDGSGYPGGLTREDIPLCGRIAAVCDVYDALTSDRPYKNAWSHDRALGYVTGSRGSHFDPEVVDAFVASLPQIRAVQVSHSDRVAPANTYHGSVEPSPLFEFGVSEVPGRS